MIVRWVKALWHKWRYRHLRRFMKNYGRDFPLKPELVELFSKRPK